MFDAICQSVKISSMAQIRQNLAKTVDKVVRVNRDFAKVTNIRLTKFRQFVDKVIRVKYERIEMNEIDGPQNVCEKVSIPFSCFVAAYINFNTRSGI